MTDSVRAGLGAWELRAGCNSLFLWWINLSAAGLGLILDPGRTLGAARRASGQRTLYRDPLSDDGLLDMSVLDLRARLGLPPAGRADRPPRLHRRAPGAASQPRLAICGRLRTLLRLCSAIVNPAFKGARVRPAA